MTTNKDIAVEAAEKEYPDIDIESLYGFSDDEARAHYHDVMMMDVKAQRAAFIKGWRAQEASAPTQREGENGPAEQRAEGPTATIEKILKIVISAYRGYRPTGQTAGMPTTTIRNELRDLFPAAQPSPSAGVVAEPVAWMSNAPEKKMITSAMKEQWRDNARAGQWTAEAALREYPIPLYAAPQQGVTASSVSVEDIVDLVAELYGDRSHKHGGGINIDQFRKRLSSLLSQ